MDIAEIKRLMRWSDKQRPEIMALLVKAEQAEQGWATASSACNRVASERDALRADLTSAKEEIERLNGLLYGGRCVYCGEVVGADTQNQDISDDVLKHHIRTCPAHPYVQMKERAEAAESSLALERKETERLREELATANHFLEVLGDGIMRPTVITQPPQQEDQ